MDASKTGIDTIYYSDEHPFDRDVNLMSVADIVTTIFSIWNLDFFRLLCKPFCLHPNLSIIQVMCLDYAIAVYPLLLIILTYMLF